MWYAICVVIGLIVGFMLRGLLEAARQTSSSEVEIPLLPPDNIDETIKTIVTRAEDKVAEEKLIIEGATDEQKTEMFNTLLDRKRQREHDSGSRTD